MRKLFRFFSNLFKLSDEDLKKIEEIDALIKEFPSARIIGRGTVYIDPAEIVASAKFKADVEDAKRLCGR